MRMEYDVTSLFLKSPPPTLFILLTENYNSCYRIEQALGQKKVSGSSIQRGRTIIPHQRSNGHHNYGPA